MARTRWMTLVGATLCVAPTLRAQPQFKGMGPDSLNKNMLIYAMSDDGEIFGMTGITVGLASAWSSDTGYFFLPPAPTTSSWVAACRPDGANIYGGVATPSGNIPVVWTNRLQAPKAIPGHPDPQVLSIGISATNQDGTVLVGSTQEASTLKLGAFIWRAGVRKNQGWEFITQFPPGTKSASILAIDDAGRTGYGGSTDVSISEFQGVRWDWKTGFTLLGDVPGGPVESWLGSSSFDGSAGGGYTHPEGPSVVASRYVHGFGWQVLGTVKPTHDGSSGTIDRSGHVMIGASWKFPDQQDQTGFIWNGRDGMRSVKDILVIDHGLTEAQSWTPTFVAQISSNGRYIAGFGKNPQGKFDTWWAEIRPFCYADCDNSTSPKGKNAGPPVLDIDDFICFQTKYAIGDYLYADCDLNGYLEIDDFICFITKFATGCD